MKKKELSKTFYILVFLAAVYLALYVFSEFRESYLAVGACGIIFLVSGYLLAAALEREKRRQEEERFQSFDQLSQHIKELIKIQKAMYTAMKKENLALSEKLDTLAGAGGGQQEELLGKIVEAQGQSISEAKRMAELQINALKTVAKYNKENTKQLALNANENADQIVKSVQVNIDSLKQQIENLKLYAAPVQKENNIGDFNSEDAAGAMDSIPIKDLEEKDKEGLEADKSSELKFPEVPKEVFEVPKFPDPEPSNLEIEEASKTSEATSPAAHSRPEAPVIDDPNRKMTPEEIAQLIAHMTQ